MINHPPVIDPAMLALQSILSELAARGRKLRLGDPEANSSTPSGALDDTGEQTSSHTNGGDR